MIDNPDYSTSTIHLLVFQALKNWESKPLVSLLYDENCIVRSAAARELQIRGEKEIFYKLIDMVKDKKSYVREICAFTLGQLGTPNKPYKQESILILQNLLKDNDAEVRASAVAALGHLCSNGMPKDIESRLILMADDKNEGVRECTAFALANSSGSKRIITTLNRLGNDHHKNVRSWAKMGLKMFRGLNKKLP